MREHLIEPSRRPKQRMKNDKGKVGRDYRILISGNWTQDETPCVLGGFDKNPKKNEREQILPFFTTVS
jgi:hypothetical protein